MGVSMGQENFKRKINLFFQSIGEDPIDWEEPCCKAFAYGVVDRLYAEGRIDEDASYQLKKLISKIHDPWEKQTGTQIEKALRE